MLCVEDEQGRVDKAQWRRLEQGLQRSIEAPDWMAHVAAQAVPAAAPAPEPETLTYAEFKTLYTAQCGAKARTRNSFELRRCWKEQLDPNDARSIAFARWLEFAQEEFPAQFATPPKSEIKSAAQYCYEVDFDDTKHFCRRTSRAKMRRGLGRAKSTTWRSCRCLRFKQRSASASWRRGRRSTRRAWRPCAIGVASLHRRKPSGSARRTRAMPTTIASW